jgi:hypothetical protein
MFQIRQEHVDAIALMQQRDFEERMNAHLREAFAQETEGVADEQMLGLIRLGIKRAASYGIELEADVERYLEYMVMYGANFDTDRKYPWAGETLRREDVPGNVKMDWIDEYDQFSANRS